jgi:hypothetical protein
MIRDVRDARVGLGLVAGGNDSRQTDCGAGRRAVASVV